MSSSVANAHVLLRLGFRRTLATPTLPIPAAALRSTCLLPKFRSIRRRYNRRNLLFQIAVIDEGPGDIPSLEEESSGVCGGKSFYNAYSSEGEESDGDLLVYPYVDVDLPVNKNRVETPDASLTVATHRFSNLRQARKRRRIRAGVLINFWLITFIGVFLLWFDWCSWRIIRLPLKPFFLTQPFTLSAILSAFAGFIYVPLVDNMKIHQILRKEGPSTHSSKCGTPTMGGLFFIPIGIIVSRFVVGDSSIQVNGAMVATLSFAAIGLLDDLLSCIKSHNYGLSGWVKLSLQVAAGTLFSFWLDSASIPTPYNMKLLAPLPPPFGLVYLGKLYLVLTTFSFAAMGNGVNLTDGLDGLAGGAAALAFVGMSVAVIAICPDLAVFGASMAGSCIGFLFHNRYKASIFMGDTGSLALGGALAAMASCTGMFFPLFVTSGLFFMEVMSVIIQVLHMKATERFYGVRRRFFRMAPVHHHFELCGFKEPVIVASAYVISYILALFAGYIGLISA
ncbi:phospho-N-acetylmuramoyl-pentapeptide-transferase homolog [Typha latifolia]|uniref:phospho-N-acetylmuramoyl-pentapeptide- transferase homolog n=1 Tax=Typha latifolia TaxID=4733 RepID=UPI003C2D4D91